VVVHLLAILLAVVATRLVEATPLAVVRLPVIRPVAVRLLVIHLVVVRLLVIRPVVERLLVILRGAAAIRPATGVRVARRVMARRRARLLAIHPGAAIPARLLPRPQRSRTL
jgi:hypothetical protein